MGILLAAACSAGAQAQPIPSGEDACEGHGFTPERCAAVGCCEFNDGQCWSGVCLAATRRVSPPPLDEVPR